MALEASSIAIKYEPIVFLGRLLDSPDCHGAMMANTRVTDPIPQTPTATVPNLGASKASIQAHYDREPRLYERFLGASLAYSAGMWIEPSNRDTLEAAQLRKLDWHINISGANPPSVCLRSASGGAV